MSTGPVVGEDAVELVVDHGWRGLGVDLSDQQVHHHAVNESEQDAGLSGRVEIGRAKEHEALVPRERRVDDARLDHRDPDSCVRHLLAERMGVSLGQPVIIENVAGADGSIGAGRVARATPDGALFGHYCERP